MRTTTAAALSLLFAACLAPNARAQAQPGGNDRDAGKQETIRGVIAGVTVEGEIAIDYSTQRAEAVQMSYMTVVGSPKRSSDAQDADKDRNKDRDRPSGKTSARHPHNVYVIWLTPKTVIKDATSNADKSQGGGTPTTLDKLEVGDLVEITYQRRDLSGTNTTPGADAKRNEWTRRHGRERVYFGDATQVTILAEPGHDHDADKSSQPKNRDDDKDKVKNR
jgi:hypothetical protein